MGPYAIVVAMVTASAASLALCGEDGPGRSPDKAKSSTEPAGNAAAQEAPLAGAIVKQTVRRLVEELGSNRFHVREAATRELILMGEGVLPVLEGLGAPTDPEVRSRLERVRHALVGWSDDLMQLVSMLEPVTLRLRPDILDRLATIVRQHQPRSGDRLLEMI